MSAPDLTPYWGDRDDWASFLLLIVGATPLPAPTHELARLVRERVAADSTLYDLVTVAHGPQFAESVDALEWERDLVVAFVAAAMPERRLLAPRAVFSVVVVGDRQSDIDLVTRILHKLAPLTRLRTRTYQLGIRPDGRTGTVREASISSIVNLATSLIADYEHKPEIAVDEATFLTVLTELVERDGLRLPRSDAPHMRPELAAPLAGTTSGPVDNSVASTIAPVRPPVQVPPPAELPTAAATAPLVSPIIHTGAEIVAMPTRSRLRRLMVGEAIDADSMDDLAQATDAVSLAYLVFVPDDERKPNSVGKRRKEIALEVDQVLGTVIGDTATGRPTLVAVEVLSATSPLRRHGALLPAGELLEKDLPKAAYEIFDHIDTVDGLLEAAQRTTRAFRARNVEVLSLHFVFLAAIKPTTTSESEWDRLLRHGRVTWIDTDPDGRLDADAAAALSRPSPFGVLALSANDDVGPLFRQESEVFYQYEAQPAPGSLDEAVQAGPESPEAPEAASESRKPRRWWPARRRQEQASPN